MYVVLSDLVDGWWGSQHSPQGGGTGVIGNATNLVSGTGGAGSNNDTASAGRRTGMGQIRKLCSITSFRKGEGVL